MRNNEILRANNRDHSGFNGEFLCGKGRFGYDFTRHPERVRQPLVRRNGKLEPASWEDALEEVARRLKQAHATHGAECHRRDRIEPHDQRRKLSAEPLRARHAGHEQLDHHRTADYAGLVGGSRAAGQRPRPRRWRMFITRMRVLLIGNDVTQQNPLVAWQIRTGVRHHGAKLYVINGVPEQNSSQGSDRCGGAEGRRGRRRFAGWRLNKGDFDAKTTEIAGSAESGARSRESMWS